MEDSPQSPADEDVSESLGRFSINQPGARSRPGGGQDQTDQPRLATEDWELQQPGGHLALGMYIESNNEFFPHSLFCSLIYIFNRIR